MSCKYCKDDPISIDRFSFELCVDSKNSQLDVVYATVDDYSCESININYCPMCGRQLGEIKKGE